MAEATDTQNDQSQTPLVRDEELDEKWDPVERSAVPE